VGCYGLSSTGLPKTPRVRWELIQHFLARSLRWLAVVAAIPALTACSTLGGIPGLATDTASSTSEHQYHADRMRAQFAAMPGGASIAAGIPKTAPNAGTHAVVKVFYGTDRRVQKADLTKIYYGPERAAMSYGQAIVSIPRDHRMGQLERPAVWRFWNTEDPEKFVVLLSAGALERGQYIGALQQDVRASRRKEALVFVHGFNVSFEDAARRTAQMKYDLGFEGPAVFFSWPSKGQVSGYKDDLETINASIDNIKNFLTEVSRDTGAATIYLVAHSMGNVGLLNALTRMTNTERARAMGKFREIVLAAPDIDRNVFINDIVPKIAGRRNRVTLYASGNDRALQASEQINKEPRAGDTRHGIVIGGGLDTIDASDVDTSLVGHAYYAENRTIMSDMFYLIQQGVAPGQRFGLESVTIPEGNYWRFKK
jgi:esterase/lipase superfamily enzyme